MTEGESRKKTKAPKKAPAKKAVTTVAAAAPAPAPAPEKKAPAKAAAKAPAKKPTKKTTEETTIVAKVDVGFGNTLFLRGTGPGLSWDGGTAMANSGSDEWVWTSKKVTKPFLAKVLINDTIWAVEEDTKVTPGSRIVITPTF